MDTRPSDWAHERQSVRRKAVLVNGGTTGIGRATARLLASQGADVFIFGRRADHMEDALKDIRPVAGGKIAGAAADVAQRADILRVFDEADRALGGLDILINNAAVAADEVDDMDDEAIEYAIRTNLLGYMLCAKHALARMQKGGAAPGGIRGHIVNVGSLSSEERERQSGVYVASKAAIQAWSESLRKQVNEKGIKVSLLEFGLVGTNIQEEPADTAKQEKQQAAQKMLTAEDIAEAVYYCLTQPPRCDVINVRLRPHLQVI